MALKQEVQDRPTVCVCVCAWTQHVPGNGSIFPADLLVGTQFCSVNTRSTPSRCLSVHLSAVSSTYSPCLTFFCHASSHTHTPVYHQINLLFELSLIGCCGFRPQFVSFVSVVGLCVCYTSAHTHVLSLGWRQDGGKTQ